MQQSPGQARPTLTFTNTAGVPWHTGVRPPQVQKGHGRKISGQARPPPTFTDAAGVLGQVVRAGHHRGCSLHGRAVEHGRAERNARWPWGFASRVQGQRVAGAGGVEPVCRRGQNLVLLRPHALIQCTIPLKQNQLHPPI